MIIASDANEEEGGISEEGEWTSGKGGHPTINPPSGRRQDQLEIRKPLWTF